MNSSILFLVLFFFFLSFRGHSVFVCVRVYTIFIVLFAIILNSINSINTNYICRLDEVNDPSLSNREIKSESSSKSEMTFTCININAKFMYTNKWVEREGERFAHSVQRNMIIITVPNAHVFILNGTLHYTLIHSRKKVESLRRANQICAWNSGKRIWLHFSL